MEIQGYSGMENLWLDFMVFYGNLTAFDLDHDPSNSTARYLSGEYWLSLSSATVSTSSDKLWITALPPGDYIWVNFFTTDNGGTAGSLSVIVSAVYK